MAKAVFNPGGSSISLSASRNAACAGVTGPAEAWLGTGSGSLPAAVRGSGVNAGVDARVVPDAGPATGAGVGSAVGACVGSGVGPGVGVGVDRRGQRRRGLGDRGGRGLGGPARVSAQAPEPA